MINITESRSANVSAADVLVRISKESVLAPEPKKYANICVLASKKNAGNDIVGQIITDKGDVANDVTELDELNFIGCVRVWNTALDATVLAEMAGWGETLVVLSGRSKDITGVDFGNMILWQSQAGKTTSMDDIASQQNRGVMIDTDKSGKALFALSHLLANPHSLAFTTAISSQNFTGITQVDLANNLDEAGYSYFFCSKDKTWARGLWIGRQQARSVYADRSVIYDVKQSVAAAINAGKNYTTDSMAQLEATIIRTLGENPFVVNILKVEVPRNQKASSKLEGIVYDVSVRYETAQEVRTVIIKLGGDV